MINILLCKRKISKTVSEKCCKYAHEKGADQMVDAADSKSAGSDIVSVRVSPWLRLEKCTIVSEKKLPLLIKILIKRLKICFYRRLC